MNALLLTLAAAFAPAAHAAPARPAAAANATVQPHVHVDRQAGVKFVVPFAHGRTVTGADIEADARRKLGARYPEGLHYTAGIYAAGNSPYILVWTKQIPGGVDRQLADGLASGETKTLTSLGLTDVFFDRQALRGEARLPDRDGWRSKVLIQLVRDRYTFIAFYYRDAAQLKGFDVVRHTLKVGKKSKLAYQTLPGSTSSHSGGWLRVLGIIALAGAIGAAAYLAYQRLTRDPASGWDPAAAKDGPAASAPGVLANQTPTPRV